MHLTNPNKLCMFFVISCFLYFCFNCLWVLFYVCLSLDFHCFFFHVPLCSESNKGRHTERLLLLPLLLLLELVVVAIVDVIINSHHFMTDDAKCPAALSQ